MSTAAEFPVYRSEAFAEDVLDLVAEMPVAEPSAVAPSRWWVSAVPIAVALLGLAFAVVPPLA